MKCENAEQRIFLYKELSERERDETDEHMRHCASCMQIMERASTSDQIIRRHRADTPLLQDDAAMTRRIMVAIGARQERSAVRTSNRQVFAMPAIRYVMAALSLVLAISFVIESTSSADMPELYPRISGDKPLLNVAAFQSAWVNSRNNRQQSAMLARCVASCVESKEECEGCANIFSKHGNQ